MPKEDQIDITNQEAVQSKQGTRRSVGILDENPTIRYMHHMDNDAN